MRIIIERVFSQLGRLVTRVCVKVQNAIRKCKELKTAKVTFSQNNVW